MDNVIFTKSSQTKEIFVKFLTGETFEISDYDFTNTLLEFKKKVAEKTNVPVALQRLIFAGKQLNDDDKTLSQLNFEKNITLHLVIRHN